MPLSALLMLLLLAGLLVASGFFSGSETALFSLSRHQRARLARSPGVAARATLTLLSETRGLLITLLMGNMTINVLYFVVSSTLLIRLGESGALPGPVVAVLTVAPLLAIILLGEVLPKQVAARLPEAFARVIALPMLGVHRLIAPLRIGAAVAVITPLSRLLAPPTPPPDLSPEELETMLQLSRHHGVIDHSEQRVLEQVLELSRLQVRQLMVPRVDVVAFDLDDAPEALMALIRETRLRHLPAFRGDLDNVVGAIHTKQALLARPQTAEDVEKLVRQVRFVPELQRADRALIDLRKSGTTFSVAVDEYGGTAGFVTLEDLVEHLVGDIPGAYEAEVEPEVEPLGTGPTPRRWRVDADLSVHDWPDVFGRHRHFEAARTLASANTVGGLVMAELGRVPAVGDRVRLGNLRLTVDRMAGHRVERVLIEMNDKDPAPESGPTGGAA
ncbi:MAG: hemolysin family protein [Planctomycetota bacterium]